MKDAELFLQIMVTIEMNGYLSGNDDVEKLIKEYDDEYSNKKIVQENLNNVIKLISGMTLPSDSIWFKKSNFFTLMVELIRYKIMNSTFPNKTDLKQLLIKFDQLIVKNKNLDVKSNKYAEYYYYTYQGTNSKKGRTIRGKLLKEYLTKL